MNKQPEKVLVLGDGVSAFLAVIRSLGRQGIEVHVGWCQSDAPALRSRYVKRAHQLPFCHDNENWADELADVLAREQFALVLPTNEQSTRALASERQRLERCSRLYVPDERVFELVFDKIHSSQLAERLGLHVPKSRIVSELGELVEMASECGYPLVLKPISTYDATMPTVRRNVVKAYNRADLEQRAPAVLQLGPVLAQENFIGRGVGVELLVDRGEVLLAFQHERVHQPPQGGASSYRKSVPLDPELLEASKKFVAALEYSGIIMVEFLVDPQTRQWRFVEVNARFWGSLPLAIAAGADFPYALHRYWVHGERSFPQGYREGLYCRDLFSDGLWFVRNLRSDRNDPTLATVSPLTVLLEARHFLRGRERFDTLTLDDPMPAAAEVMKYARRYSSRLELRLRRLGASLPGVRQRQSAQARDALARAHRVIFLCWGNICRSPFAGCYARQVWPPQIEVLSRGSHYQQGRVSPAEAIEAARECDVMLEEHRSSLISAEEAAAADMIVCFDELVLREFRKRFPHESSKAFRFGVLRKRGGVSVEDPFGGDLSKFREVYAQIKETLDETCSLFPGAMVSRAAGASVESLPPE